MKILIHTSPLNFFPRECLSLGVQLREQGHTPVFSCAPQNKPLLEAQGFACELLHPHVFESRAYSDFFVTTDHDEHQMLKEELQSLIALDYFEIDFFSKFQDLDIDLAVCDTALDSPLQFLCYQQNIPCLQISFSWPLKMTPDSPPASAHMNHESTNIDLLGARWQESCLNGTTLGSRHTWLIAAQMERYADAFGYPHSALSFYSSCYPALTAFPELSICPQALDFPTPENSAKDELISFLALDYAESKHHIVPDSLQRILQMGFHTRICISLETHRTVIKRTDIAMTLVREFAKSHPDIQFVFLSPATQPCNSEALKTSNVFYSDVQHLDIVLDRSDFFVTDGDMSAVRAAIHFECPIVVIPFGMEQKGTASRIAFHKLGIRLLPDLLSLRTFSLAIERLQDPQQGFTQNVRDMKIKIEAEYECQQARAVETLVALTPSLAAGSTCHRSEAQNYTFPAGKQHAYLSSSVTSFEKTISFENILYQHALFCALSVLEEEYSTHPERAVFFRDKLLGAHQRLLKCLFDSDENYRERFLIFKGLFAEVLPYWFHGYGAVVKAVHPCAYKAARGAQFEACCYLTKTTIIKESEAVFLPIFRSHNVRLNQRLEQGIEKQLNAQVKQAISSLS